MSLFLSLPFVFCCEGDIYMVYVLFLVWLKRGRADGLSPAQAGQSWFDLGRAELTRLPRLFEPGVCKDVVQQLAAPTVGLDGLVA